jgi:homoserine kinase
VLHSAVEVLAPASSANLGPGFDSLGLALKLYDRLSVQVLASGLRVEVSGVCADDVPRDETHLVVRAMRAAFERMEEPLPGMALACLNGVPHGRGLGSSAAAIVGGIVAARALVVDGAQRLPDAAALQLACELEGHPDNVAACLLGGLTFAWSDSGAWHAVRVESTVELLALVPEQPVSTVVARGLLPDSVSHSDAAANAGRAALLVAALRDASLRTPGVLLAATRDRLHQGARAKAMPNSLELVTRLRAQGHAAVLSGAGPTVLVVGAAGADGDAVRAATPRGWRCYVLGVEPLGARVVSTH